MVGIMGSKKGELLIKLIYRENVKVGGRRIKLDFGNKNKGKKKSTYL